MQQFLKEGQPELAAKLLAETEVTLLASRDHPTMHGLKKAALHTLWAAVLEDVGEKEKAAKLYDQALGCLKQDQLDSDSEASDEPRFLLPPQRPLGVEEKMQLLMSRSTEPAEPPGEFGESEPRASSASDNSSSAGTHHTSAPAEELQAAPSLPAPGAPSVAAPKAGPYASASRTQAVPAAPAPSSAEEAPALAPTSVEAAAPPAPSSVEAATPAPIATIVPSSAQVKACPSTAAKAGSAGPKTPPAAKAAASIAGASGSNAPARVSTPQAKAPKKRPVPMAPKNQAVRVGGGFRLQPKAPPKSAPKAARKAKAKAKAEPEAEQEVAEVDKPLDPEALEKLAQRAMVTADHFLGLEKWQRAADVLEEQLSEILKGPLCNSDLHVDLLQCLWMPSFHRLVFR